MFSFKKLNKKGFTLVELIVVLGILGVLVTMAVPRFVGHTEKAKTTALKSDIRVAEDAVVADIAAKGGKFELLEDLTEAQVQSVADEDNLFSIKGGVGLVESGDYKLLDKDFINSKFEGAFYGNEGGRVYYNKSGDVGIIEETVKEEEIVKKSIKRVYASFNGTYASTIDGALYAWGWNASGQLGLGDTEHRTLPVQVNIQNVKDAYGGTNHTLATTTNGDLYSWGGNDNGQLGLGHNDMKTTPQKINLRDVQDVAAGDAHNVVLTKNGDVYTFGRNQWGQLGLGDTVDRNSPTKVNIPGKVVKIYTGDWHAIAVTENGDLYGWGANKDGQLGLSSLTDILTPTKLTQLMSIGKIKTISTGGYHTLLLTDADDLYAIGRNGNGQIGDGTYVKRTTPYKVTDAPKGIKTILAGGFHSAVLTNNGDMYTWGRNNYGQLGLPDGIGHTGGEQPKGVSLPIKVNISNVRQIAGGAYHTLTFNEDGTMFTFGKNQFGQLGLGDMDKRDTPTKVEGLGW